MPAAPSIAAGWLLERVAGLVGQEGLVTAETMRTAAGISRYDNRKAREVLGLSFTPIRDVVADTAAAYRQQFPR